MAYVIFESFHIIIDPLMWELQFGVLQKGSPSFQSKEKRFLFSLGFITWCHSHFLLVSFASHPTLFSPQTINIFRNDNGTSVSSTRLILLLMGRVWGGLGRFLKTQDWFRYDLSYLVRHELYIILNKNYFNWFLFHLSKFLT